LPPSITKTREKCGRIYRHFIAKTENNQRIMENRRKTREIIIEISRRRNDFKRTRNRAWCFKCEVVAELLTFPQAADFCRTTLYDIYQRAENGEFHLIHNSKGEVLICQTSVQKHRIYSAEKLKVGEFVQQII
jgi:hypothetical protein